MDSPPSVYFTRDEIVIHNMPNDIWITIHEVVFDLSNFIKNRSETLNDNLRLLIQYAGKDLSWGFTKHGNPLERVNQHLESVPAFPPVREKEADGSNYWWCIAGNIIGRLTCIERRIRVINTLTRKIILMNVCEEDSIQKIQEKYSKRFNRDSENYIWRKTSTQDKASGRIFYEKSLTQNGILYEKNEKLGLPPALWLYFVLNKG